MEIIGVPHGNRHSVFVEYIFDAIFEIFSVDEDNVVHRYKTPPGLADGWGADVFSILPAVNLSNVIIHRNDERSIRGARTHLYDLVTHFIKPRSDCKTEEVAGDGK